MRALLAIALAVLLSGCVLVEEDDGAGGDAGDQPRPTASGGPGPGPGFAAQQGSANGSRDGIHLDVHWRACEAGFCGNATVTNRGAEPVSISSICVPPWEERMMRDGKPVQHQEGRAYCAAYGVRDFAPGEALHANFTWDRRLWTDGTPRPATEGAYTWSIVFWWQPQEGQPRREAKADIPLVVGET